MSIFKMVLIAAVGALLLSGCVATGVQVDEKNLQSFERGKTTYGDVVARLGQPTSNTLLPDGRRMIMYTYMQAQARPENFIPIVGAFVGGADTRSSVVSITFDQTGILETYSSSQSQFGASTGLAAGTGPSDRVSHQPRSDAAPN